MKTNCRIRLIALKLWKAGLLGVAVICLGHTLLFADDFTDAMKKAKAEDKAAVLYFYNQYCPYCTAMEKEVLADKDVTAMLKKDVVFLRIDVDKRPDLGSKYGIRGYPTTCALEPTGKPVFRVPGYMNKKEFGLVVDFARKKVYKTTSLRDYLKRSGIHVD